MKLKIMKTTVELCLCKECRNKEGKLNRTAKNMWIDGSIKLHLFILVY
jgi:hypothetical protein